MAALRPRVHSSVTCEDVVSVPACWSTGRLLGPTALPGPGAVIRAIGAAVRRVFRRIGHFLHRQTFTVPGAVPGPQTTQDVMLRTHRRDVLFRHVTLIITRQEGFKRPAVPVRSLWDHGRLSSVWRRTRSLQRCC